MTEEQFVMLMGRLGERVPPGSKQRLNPGWMKLNDFNGNQPNGAIGPSGSNEPSEEQTLRCSRSWKRSSVLVQTSRRMS